MKKRKGKSGELARLQELRIEAEQAKVDALAAKHEADREREALERERGALEREAAAKAALNELRTNLKLGTVVLVQRFGATGRVVKVDAKKQTVTVSVGIGQWEVPFDEIFPA